MTIVCVNIDKLTSYAGHRRLVVGLVEMWCSKISSKLTTGFLVTPKSSADSVYSALKLSRAHITEKALLTANCKL